MPRKMKEVVLFIDAETQQYVTTDPDHNQATVLLAKIRLDRLPKDKTKPISDIRHIYVQNAEYLLAS